jgi:hypothetical protein
VYKVYFKKVLCGTESWTCTKRKESKIQIIEMKFLRAVMGRTKTERESEVHTLEKSSGWWIYRMKVREID